MHRILLFGGAFDPPHRGHTVSADNLLSKVRPDVMIVMPSGIPPHKTISSGAKAVDRLEMSRLAFGPLEKKHGIPVVVSDRELIKREKCYTVDTVDELYGVYGKDSEISLYMGSDMICCLESWHRYEELLKKCVIYTASRPGSFESGEFYEKCRLFSAMGKGIRVIEQAPEDVSSTEIRALLGELRDRGDKETSEKCSRLLTAEVFRYIIKRKLYG